ncbi:DnaJ family domain-containing protein [Aestuariivita sp.]|uniref:DnaJ family domain-containing protein n=1 Tax=Aestuariivita sp. TaxID=1872407 RepID=UPI00344490AA
MHKALSEGRLSGLAGEGKPLPERSGDALIDPGLAGGHRIMAEAGVRPEEFDLKEKQTAARQVYGTLTGPDENAAAMARIAEREMRCNLSRDARRAFYR